METLCYSIFNDWLNDNCLFTYDDKEELFNPDYMDICVQYTIENIGRDYITFGLTRDDVENAMLDSYYDCITKKTIYN